MVRRRKPVRIRQSLQVMIVLSTVAIAVAGCLQRVQIRAPRCPTVLAVTKQCCSAVARYRRREGANLPTVLSSLAS